MTLKALVTPTLRDGKCGQVRVKVSKVTNMESTLDWTLYASAHNILRISQETACSILTLYILRLEIGVVR